MGIYYAPKVLQGREADSKIPIYSDKITVDEVNRMIDELNINNEAWYEAVPIDMVSGKRNKTFRPYWIYCNQMEQEGVMRNPKIDKATHIILFYGITCHAYLSDGGIELIGKNVITDNLLWWYGVIVLSIKNFGSWFLATLGIDHVNEIKIKVLASRSESNKE